MDASGQPTTIAQYTSSPIPSLNNVTNHAYPKFDTAIPDQYRYEIWKQDFETNGPANLNMFWLSSDHTGGPLTPQAQVADNDLATGKIVDTISHSPYWKDSAIFVVEDDSQAGLDHVDGHRAPVQVISPWAQHGVVDNTYYSQITMIRTIEQILGVRPMKPTRQRGHADGCRVHQQARLHAVQRGAEPDLVDPRLRNPAELWLGQCPGAGRGRSAIHRDPGRGAADSRAVGTVEVAAAPDRTERGPGTTPRPCR